VEDKGLKKKPVSTPKKPLGSDLPVPKVSKKAVEKAFKKEQPAKGVISDKTVKKTEEPKKEPVVKKEIPKTVKPMIPKKALETKLGQLEQKTVKVKSEELKEKPVSYEEIEKEISG